MLLFIIWGITPLSAHQRDTLGIGGRTYFTENQGQWSAPFLFQAQMHNAAFFAESDCFTIVLRKEPTETHNPHHFHHQLGHQMHAYKVHFVGCSPQVDVSGRNIDIDGGYDNYYYGHDPNRWATHMPHYGTVYYSDLYPGIDLDVQVATHALKTNFYVAPGADVSDISMLYEGADKLYLSNGNLIIRTSVGELVELEPYAYQETDRPPADLSLRCRENVVPVLCGLHKACRSHPLTDCGAVDGDDSFENLFGEKKPQIAEDFANWVKIADRTYIYDYTINFLNTAQFFSNFGTMQQTMKYMRDTGITGYIYNCGDGHEAAFNELRNYLLCKVQWDVECDVEYWMNEFLKGYYGEAAAPYIKEIIDIQTSQISATAHAFDFDWHYQSGFYPLYTVAKLDSLWNKALNADITKDEKFNVERAQLSWEYYKANLFIGRYFFLNPLRMKANKELYDAFKSHGINRICSFGLIPEKENLSFIERPIEWR